MVCIRDALHTTSPSAATAASRDFTREYTAATDTYYQYDGSGNTVAKQEASGTTYYQYDFENLMTRIDFADDSHNYFGYDADSKRVAKEDSEGYRRLVYEGPNMLKLLQEEDADGDAVVQYTMGSALEAMRRANGGDLASGATSFYHFDWLGSTFALTDTAEAPTGTWLYGAWGEVLNRTGLVANPHTYIGKERYYRMPNASLYHLGFRDYAAGVGRFVTVDPLAAWLPLTLEAAASRLTDGRAALRLRNAQHNLLSGSPVTLRMRSHGSALSTSLSAQWDPYAYAAGAPPRITDPLGLQGVCDSDGDCDDGCLHDAMRCYELAQSGDAACLVQCGILGFAGGLAVYYACRLAITTGNLVLIAAACGGVTLVDLIATTLCLNSCTNQFNEETGSCDDALGWCRNVRCV